MNASDHVGDRRAIEIAPVTSGRNHASERLPATSSHSRQCPAQKFHTSVGVLQRIWTRKIRSINGGVEVVHCDTGLYVHQRALCPERRERRQNGVDRAV